MKVRRQESEVVSVLEEVLSSIRVVKAFAREDYEQHRFEQESRESVEKALLARNIKAKLPPIVEMIVACGTCLVLCTVRVWFCQDKWARSCWGSSEKAMRKIRLRLRECSWIGFLGKVIF